MGDCPLLSPDKSMRLQFFPACAKGDCPQLYAAFSCMCKRGLSPIARSIKLCETVNNFLQIIYKIGDLGCNFADEI